VRFVNILFTATPKCYCEHLTPPWTIVENLTPPSCTWCPLPDGEKNWEGNKTQGGQEMEIRKGDGKSKDRDWLLKGRPGLAT